MIVYMTNVCLLGVWEGLFILFILLKEDGVLDMVFERMLWLEEEKCVLRDYDVWWLLRRRLYCMKKEA